MDLILSQIDKALKEKGLSDAAASRLAVGHTSLIKNFRMKREGEKRYNLAALEKLAEVLDLELYFGPPRETGDAPHHIIEGDDYAKIAFYDVPASAGPGAAADPNASIESYAFRRDWLKRLGVAPQNAAMLRVRGDSMAPKIVDGDVLLIDTARREPPIRPQTKGKARSGIYVVDVDGETRVKRVERPDFQNLILYSEDTTSYPPEAFLGRDQERLKFIGKVIWWSHTVDI